MSTTTANLGKLKIVRYMVHDVGKGRNCTHGYHDRLKWDRTTWYTCFRQCVELGCCQLAVADGRALLAVDIQSTARQVTRYSHRENIQSKTQHSNLKLFKLQMVA